MMRGFDQPFVIRPIGNTWGLDNLEGDGFFHVGGFLSEIDSGDIVRGQGLSLGLVSRTLHDPFRLGKFMLTPKGIFFLKQRSYNYSTQEKRREFTILYHWVPF